MMAMRYRKQMAVLLLMLAMVMQPSAGHAAVCKCEEEGRPCDCERTLEQVAEEWENRCRCTSPDVVNYEYTATSYENDSDSAAPAEETTERFIEIHRDDSFIYKMDRKTARFLNIPHMAKEKMIDVWIKLEPREFLEGDYTFPAKYYLEHYLIRPKRQQIQFLAEMEVAGGRPTNDALNRRYDGRLWEDLIPGSIEDTIYHAVLLHKDDIYDESSSDGTSIRDYIENTVNISL